MGVNPVPPEDPTDPSWVPTRKFVSAAVTALIVYVVSRVTEIDKDTEQLIQFGAPLIAAYLIRNKKTIEGKGL